MDIKELVASACLKGSLDGNEKYKARLTRIAQRVIEYGEQCVKEAQGSSKEKVEEELKATKKELEATKEELKAAKTRLDGLDRLMATVHDP